jgi:Ankyrin repeats (3 copies)
MTQLSIWCQVVDVLIAAGANVDKKTQLGKTPLHEAARSRCPSVIKSLITAGANPNTKDHLGMTPLHQFVKCGKSLGIVSTLINAGAQIEAKTNTGHTPLYYCKCAGTAAELVAHGADPDALPSGMIRSKAWTASVKDAQRTFWVAQYTPSFLRMRECGTLPPSSFRLMSGTKLRATRPAAVGDKRKQPDPE